MPRLRSIDRALRRHRLLAAGSGILIALGVVALNAHAALPEHHHHHGEETVCAAALSIAVATGALWLARRRPGPTGVPRPVGSRPLITLAAAVPREAPRGPRSRAGPALGLTVLRR